MGLWAEGRVNNEYEAIKIPVSRISKYDNLKELFNSELKKVYTEDEYEQRFSLKVNKYLEEMERMVKKFDFLNKCVYIGNVYIIQKY